MGVMSGIQMEMIQNKWKHAGGHIADGLIITSQWLPTTFETQISQVQLTKYLNAMVNYTIIASLELWRRDQKFINLTQCAFSTLSYHIQVNRAREELQSGNYHTWLKYFKGLDLENTWFEVPGREIECEEQWCAGRFNIYMVEGIEVMCKLIVMPLLVGEDPPEFWYPEIYGHYADTQDRTHDLCLLKHQSNICKFQRMPVHIGNRFMEIGPQHICLITNDNDTMRSLNRTAPFSGCIMNVKVFKWLNDTFIFESDADKTFNREWAVDNLTDTTPFVISLEPLLQVLKESEILRKYIETHEHYLRNNLLSAIIDKGKLIHLSSQIKEETTHHWYDVFSGWSPTATKTFSWIFSPILILILGLAIVTVINCCIYARIKRRVKRLKRRFSTEW
uniref:Freeze tolerance-associated protein FR47 n=1 Tax=Lithobates sylvaticus TaxID=45438 RepID=Q8JGN4_LITSY|nr:freeze tolerance-associated protein FR47 [Lithobates sylvaticus]